MRNKENYNAAIKDIQASVNAGISINGIKFDSPLNRSRYLHVAEHTVLDCMHDFLEGVISFIVKLILRNYVIKGLYKISAAELNRRLQCFQFSFYDQDNKPSAKFRHQI